MRLPIADCSDRATLALLNFSSTRPRKPATPRNDSVDVENILSHRQLIPCRPQTSPSVSANQAPLLSPRPSLRRKQAATRGRPGTRDRVFSKSRAPPPEPGLAVQANRLRSGQTPDPELRATVVVPTSPGARFQMPALPTLAEPALELTGFKWRQTKNPAKAHRPRTARSSLVHNSGTRAHSHRATVVIDLPHAGSLYEPIKVPQTAREPQAPPAAYRLAAEREAPEERRPLSPELVGWHTEPSISPARSPRWASTHHVLPSPKCRQHRARVSQTAGSMLPSNRTANEAGHFPRPSHRQEAEELKRLAEANNVLRSEVRALSLVVANSSRANEVEAPRPVVDGPELSLVHLGTESPISLPRGDGLSESEVNAMLEEQVRMLLDQLERISCPS